MTLANHIPWMMAGAVAERQQLIRLLAKQSLKRGRFTLSSGKVSELYIDARLTTMSPEGLALIGPLAITAIRNAGWNINSVGGLTLGADPVAFSISNASNLYPPLLRAFTVRKTPKSHGTTQLIEGPFQKGDHVLIVEDVITTGASVLQAIDAVIFAGGHIEGVLTVVDRQDGGRQKIENRGYSVVTLVQLPEITEIAPSGF